MEQYQDQTADSETGGNCIMRTYIIIDDEPLIRKGTRKKLQAMEDRVTCIGETGEGREGIDVYKRQAILSLYQLLL